MNSVNIQFGNRVRLRGAFYLPLLCLIWMCTTPESAAQSSNENIFDPSGNFSTTANVAQHRKSLDISLGVGSVNEMIYFDLNFFGEFHESNANDYVNEVKFEKLDEEAYVKLKLYIYQENGKHILVNQSTSQGASFAGNDQYTRMNCYGGSSDIINETFDEENRHDNVMTSIELSDCSSIHKAMERSITFSKNGHALPGFERMDDVKSFKDDNPLDKSVLMIAELEMYKVKVKSIKLAGIGTYTPFALFGRSLREGLFSSASVRVNDEEPIPFEGHLNWADRNIHMGDEITVTITPHLVASIDNYWFDGIPSVWKSTLSSYNSKVYCSPSINPGELNPFVAFSSQIHGIFPRNQEQIPNFEKYIDDWEDNGDGSWSWTFTCARRMDANQFYQPRNIPWNKEKHAPAGKTFNGGYERQRRDQHTGLAMELLRAWQSDYGTEYTGDYKEFNGKKLIYGGDPDEFLHFNSKFTTENVQTIHGNDLLTGTANIYNGAILNFIEDAPGHQVVEGQTLLNLQDDSSEPASYSQWKYIPPYESRDPLHDIVNAYYRHQGSGQKCVAYEIEDQLTFLDREEYEKGNKVNCDTGTQCIFDPRTDLVDNNLKAPGMITLNSDLVEPKRSIKLTVKAPVKVDYGMYGSIIGTQWPAKYEENVPYTVKGLDKTIIDDPNQTYILQYEVERADAFWYLDTKYLRNPADHDGQIKCNTSGECTWTVNFDIQEYGSMFVSAYYKRTPNSDSVMFANKELMEVGLRYIYSPGTKGKQNGPDAYVEGDLDLKSEDRNWGSWWYMNSDNHSTFRSPVYGDKDYRYSRIYTLKKGTTISFSAMDIEPNTFDLAADRFFFSERTLSKVILDDSLKNRGYLQWVLYPIEQTSENNIKLGNPLESEYGRHFRHTWENEGAYELKAVYRGEDFRLPVRIWVNVVDYKEVADNEPQELGEIKIYDLSPNQRKWLGLNEENSTYIYKIASVEDILSEYLYVDGPRNQTKMDGQWYHYPKPARFGQYNDFYGYFKWGANKSSGFSNVEENLFTLAFSTGDLYNLSHHEDSPSNDDIMMWMDEGSFINYKIPLLSKIPELIANWSRHTGNGFLAGANDPDGRLKGMPVDIPLNLEIRRDFERDGSDVLSQYVNEIFQSKPDDLLFKIHEPWQWRLPWVQFNNWDDSPLTRWEPKVIYNMTEFFNDEDGAFTGKAGAFKLEYNDQNYEEFYNGMYQEFRKKYNDELKQKQLFFTDLMSGRKIIFKQYDNLNSQEAINSLQVYNVYHDEEDDKIKRKFIATTDVITTKLEIEEDGLVELHGVNYDVYAINSGLANFVDGTTNLELNSSLDGQDFNFAVAVHSTTLNNGEMYLQLGLDNLTNSEHAIWVLLNDNSRDRLFANPRNNIGINDVNKIENAATLVHENQNITLTAYHVPRRVFLAENNRHELKGQLSDAIILLGRNPKIYRPSDPNHKFFNRNESPNEILVSAKPVEWSRDGNVNESITVLIADGVESIDLDIEITKDGKLLVFQDDTPFLGTNFGTESITELDIESYISAISIYDKNDWGGAFLEIDNTINTSKALAKINDICWEDSGDQCTSNLTGLQNAILRNHHGEAINDENNHIITLENILETVYNDRIEYHSDVVLTINKAIENGYAFEVYKLAMDIFGAEAASTVVFKGDMREFTYQSLKDKYGKSFLKQINYIPQYQFGFGEAPWPTYLAFKYAEEDQLISIPAYELQDFKASKELDRQKYNQIQAIRQETTDSKWIGHDMRVPTGCNNYFMQPIFDECELAYPGCANFERGSDLNYTIREGATYILSDDIDWTQRFQEKLYELNQN